MQYIATRCTVVTIVASYSYKGAIYLTCAILKCGLIGLSLYNMPPLKTTLHILKGLCDVMKPHNNYVLHEIIAVTNYWLI